MPEHVATARGVTEVLSSPAAVVPPEDDPVKARMSRFSEGEDHDRRRRIAVSALASVSPGDLRQRASALTRRSIAGCDELDVMPLAREVPVAVLADALGIPPALEVDDPSDEVAVNRMALLFQACDATAGLIGNALVAAGQGWDGTVDDLVRHTNRTDPSVRVTTRVTAAPVEVEGTTIPAGRTIVVQLADANSDDEVFTFGVGRRPCPGEAHALGLAAGVLDVLTENGVEILGPVSYEDRPNLRIPQGVRLRLPPCRPGSGRSPSPSTSACPTGD